MLILNIIMVRVEWMYLMQPKWDGVLLRPWAEHRYMYVMHSETAKTLGQTDAVSSTTCL